MTAKVHCAEFVFPGHPDKLSDAIADALVQEAGRREKRALVGVEVAVHRSSVFVTGRIACRDAEEIDVAGIVRDVYLTAGYGGAWGPSPDALKISTDLCLGPLEEGEAEFRAVGRSLARRGADSDEILRFLGECFANDEVTLNGQTFLFKPRPIRPPILIGGRAPHAITRALRYGDGWLPMGPLAKLRPGIDAYRQQAADAGKAPPQIVTFAGLPLDASARCREILDEYRDAGVTTLVVGGGRYESAEEHIDTIAGVAEYLSYLTG